LGPFGTGCFDLVIDPFVLQEHAQAKHDEEVLDGGNTPILEEFDSNRKFLMTPMRGNTPDYNNLNRPTSEYSVPNTPGY
jgi:hypothetical protein